MNQIAVILEQWNYTDFKEWLNSGTMTDKYCAHIFFRENGYIKLWLWSL